MWSLEQLFDWLSPTYAQRRREWAARQYGYRTPQVDDSGGTLEQKLYQYNPNLAAQLMKDNGWTNEQWQKYMTHPIEKGKYKGTL